MVHYKGCTFYTSTDMMKGTNVLTIVIEFGHEHAAYKYKVDFSITNEEIVTDIMAVGARIETGWQADFCKELSYLSDSVKHEILHRAGKDIMKWVSFNLYKTPAAPVLTNSKPHGNQPSGSAELSHESRKLPGIYDSVPLPCCGSTYTTVFAAIAHLNDDERWTREHIADWLDELQDKHGYDFTFKVEV